MPTRGEEMGDADKRSKMRGDAPPGDRVVEAKTLFMALA